MIRLLTGLFMYHIVVQASYPKKRSRLDRFIDWFEDYIIPVVLIIGMVSGFLFLVGILYYGIVGV